MSLDFGKKPAEPTKEELAASLGIQQTPPITPAGAQVIRKRMHTITELTIYPNGNIYPRVMNCWLDKQDFIVKKKETPKAKVEGVQVGEVEEL